MTLRHLLERGGGPGLLLPVLALFLSSRQVDSLYLQDCRWTVNQTLGRDLCVQPDAEFAESGMLADFAYPIYHRQARALSSGHFNRARFLEEKTPQKAAVGELERVYEYDILVSESMMEEGLSNLGDTINIRRAMHKLATGQPVKVVALGGSVTKGHGPLNITNSWVNRVFSWMNETFPHPDHVLSNQAIPAVTSAYVSPCVLNLVPDDADLIFVEFTLNDSMQNQFKRLDDLTTRGLERMLRKLLRLNGQPGIIYVHWWAGRMLKDDYAGTAEDAINTILKFYGIMGLSMRDAVHQIQVRNEDELMAQIFHPNTSWDKFHPTCIGSRFLADLVIGHLQDAAAAEVVDHRAATAGDGDHRSGLHHNRLAADALGPPLQKDNWANMTETCVLDEEFRAMIRPGEGWEWVDEGKHGSHKWGFIANQPGDSLEVDISLSDVRFANNELTIGLGFLVSFEHMGMALVECMAGCQCDSREFSFIHPAWELGTSMTAWKPVDVTIPEGSLQCTLRVTILEKTKSEPPEHKVKLTSLMISGEKGFIMPCGGGECFQ